MTRYKLLTLLFVVSLLATASCQNLGAPAPTAPDFSLPDANGGSALKVRWRDDSGGAYPRCLRIQVHAFFGSQPE